MRPLLLVLIGVTSICSVVLLWVTEVPLGVPGEWTWARISPSADALPEILFLVGTAILYLGFVGWASRLITHCRPRRTALVLGSLVVLGFTWLAAVQAAVPGIAGLSKSPFVLYYPRSSGYFWQARYEVATTTEFLTGYEELMAERDYLHIGTHPPGLTLLFRGLLSTLEDRPTATRVILATQPSAVDEAAQIIRQQSRMTRYVFTESDQACLWIWTVLVQLSAAAVVVPLFLLLSMRVDRASALFASAMWPLVPAIAVFLPKSDVLFPFLSVLAAWLWWSGWRRQSPGICVAAGVVVFAGMLCSLAFLPTSALIGLWTLLDAVHSRRENGTGLKPRAAVICLAGGLAGFVVPALVLWSVCDLNLFSIWRWNFENHALFYDHNTRTFWKWLLVNPLELTLAAGAPLAVLALVGVMHSLRARRHTPFVLSLLAVWGLLWISGKNMGEAARLWIILMPWLSVAAGLFVGNGDATESPPGRRFWLTVLAFQIIISALTVTRIDGFHFEQVRHAAPADDQTALSGILTRSPSVSRASSAISHRSRPWFFAA